VGAVVGAVVGASGRSTVGRAAIVIAAARGPALRARCGAGIAIVADAASRRLHTRRRTT
jgi:hypothetical protein